MTDQKRYTIGLMIHHLENEYSTEVLKGAIIAAEEHDVNLLLLPGRGINAVADDEKYSIYDYQYNVLYQYVSQQNLDALIISAGTIGSYITHDEMLRFLKSYDPLPIVTMEVEFEGYPCVSFHTDGMKLAVNYLIQECGCRKIAYVSGPAGNPDAVNRMQCYQQALKENGIPYHPDLVGYGNFSEQSDETVRELLHRNPDIDAICFANDKMCIGGYLVLEEMGLQVGKDILITGFDDSEVAASLKPMLTTVRTNLSEMGYNAVTQAIALLKNGTAKSITLSSSLVVRESCMAKKDTDYSSNYLSKISHDASPGEIVSDIMNQFIEQSKSLRKIPVIQEIRSLLESILSHLMEHKSLPLEVYQRRIISAFYQTKRIPVPVGTLKKVVLLFAEVTEQYCRQQHQDFTPIHKLYDAFLEQLVDYSIRHRYLLENQLTYSNFLISNINADMMFHCNDEEKSFYSIVSNLQKVNFKSSYIFVFDVPLVHYAYEKWNAPANCYLKAFHTPNSSEQIAPENQAVPTFECIQRALSDDDQRHTLIMTPLFSNEEQYGIFLCELEMENFSQIYSVAPQICSAIQLNRLVKELEGDLEEVRFDNQRLKFISNSDDMTGVYNQRGFYRYADMLLQSPVSIGKNSVLIVADLDKLRIINETFGREAGDHAIQTAVAILKKSFRSTDIIARLGGDTFAVYAIVTQEEYVGKIYGRIQETMQEYNQSSDDPYNVTMSIGIHRIQCGTQEHIQDHMQQAYEALDQDKQLKNSNVIKAFVQEKMRKDKTISRSGKMKTTAILVRETDQLEREVQELHLSPEKEYYICIHTTLHTMDSAVAAAQLLRQKFPNAVITGTSASAVLWEAQPQEHACLIMFTEFSYSKVRALLLPFQKREPSELAELLAHSLCEKNTQAAFIFLTGCFHGINTFLEIFNQYRPDVVLGGGVVSPTETLQNSFVFTPDGAMAHALLLVIFDSDNMAVTSDCAIGYEPISEEVEITRMDEGTISEIDDVDALTWYTDILGITRKKLEDNKEGDYLGYRFPLILSGSRHSVCYVTVHPQKQTIQLDTDTIHLGQKLRLGYISPIVSIRENKELAKKMLSAPMQSLFGYPSLTRCTMMNGCSQWELSPYKEANLYGAYLRAEIGSTGGINEFTNGANCLIAMSENQVHKKIQPQLLDNVRYLNDPYQNYLNHVLKQQFRTMQKRKEKILADISEPEGTANTKLTRDALTHLENVTKFQYDNQDTKYRKLCMVSIGKSERLLSHLGQERMDALYLKNVQEILRYLKDKAVHVYANEQYSFFFTATDEMSTEDFVALCEQISEECVSCSSDDNSINMVNQYDLVLEEENLLEKAKMCMAEHSVRNTRFYIYDKSLESAAEVDRVLQITKILTDAIEQDGITPFFQPICCNQNLKIQKFESLMRIRDRNGTIYTPPQFMDIAKEYYLYLPISRIMIEKVFALFRNRTESVSINLSAYDICSPNFEDFLFSALERQPEEFRNRLIFEILESEDFRDKQQLTAFVSRVKTYGVQIAIDDFGSGYSNLLEIVEIKPDFIKLDGDLIIDIDKHPNKQICIHSVVQMANSFHAQLIAERVETKEEQQTVSDLGIDFTQGYYFSKPLPFDEINSFLEAHNQKFHLN